MALGVARKANRRRVRTDPAGQGEGIDLYGQVGNDPPGEPVLAGAAQAAKATARMLHRGLRRSHGVVRLRCDRFRLAYP